LRSRSAFSTSTEPNGLRTETLRHLQHGDRIVLRESLDCNWAISLEFLFEQGQLCLILGRQFCKFVILIHAATPIFARAKFSGRGKQSAANPNSSGKVHLSAANVVARRETEVPPFFSSARQSLCRRASSGTPGDAPVELTIRRLVAYGSHICGEAREARVVFKWRRPGRSELYCSLS
jgi:hypothetical protein